MSVVRRWTTLNRGESRLPRSFIFGYWDDTRFDAITFWAVIEHVDGPKAFLIKAAMLLKPNGLCFVLVPNMKSLATRLLGAKYRYIYPQHLNYFTAETLQKLSEGHFSIVELRSTHFNPFGIWQIWCRGGEEV